MRRENVGPARASTQRLAAHGPRVPHRPRAGPGPGTPLAKFLRVFEGGFCLQKRDAAAAARVLCLTDADSLPDPRPHGDPPFSEETGRLGAQRLGGAGRAPARAWVPSPAQAGRPRAPAANAGRRHRGRGLRASSGCDKMPRWAWLVTTVCVCVWLTGLEAGGPRPGCQPGRVRAPFQVADFGQLRGVPWQGADPIQEAPPSWPKHLPEAPPPNASTSAGRFQAVHVGKPSLQSEAGITADA